MGGGQTFAEYKENKVYKKSFYDRNHLIIWKHHYVDNFLLAQ